MDVFSLTQEKHLNLNEIPRNIKDRCIRNYFSSKKSKVFLSIIYVLRDKSSGPLVGKEEPANDSSSAVQSSQEGDARPVQSQSTTKGEIDTKSAQLPGMTRINSGNELSKLSIKEKDSDTTITAQPQSLTKKDEVSSKRKASHGCEPVHDLIMYVHLC